MDYVTKESKNLDFVGAIDSSHPYIHNNGKMFSVLKILAIYIEIAKAMYVI